ncbi:protein EVI2B [Myripristis murdjan]|nr:protein EVI2B [Myripristis murdjan]
MRTICFVFLIFLWLLPLTVNGMPTPSYNHITTNLTTGEVTASEKTFTSGFHTDDETVQLSGSSMNTTTIKPVGVLPTLDAEAAGTDFTLTQIATTTETLITTASPGPFQPPAQYSATLGLEGSTDTQTVPNPSISVLSWSNDSTTEGTQNTTGVPPQLASSATTAITIRTNISITEAPSTSPPPSTASQNPSRETTSNLTATRKHLTSPPLVGPTQATTYFLNETRSATPAEHNSTHEGTVTVDGDSGGATRHTEGMHKTSMATTRKPLIVMTKAKKKPKTQEKNTDNKSKANNHGIAVAWIIGAALVLMLVGFLVIYVKKQKLQKQQVNTRDWAGPSPFLDGAHDSNGQVEMRSFNRVSLTSFLPQRLSRRLSLLQEMDEEDIKTDSTFRDNPPGSTFGIEVAKDDTQAGNETAVVVSEKTQMGEAQEADGPLFEETTPQTSDTSSTPNPETKQTAAPSEPVDLGEDNSATAPPPSHSVDPSPPPLLDEGQVQT